MEFLSNDLVKYAALGAAGALVGYAINIFIFKGKAPIAIMISVAIFIGIGRIDFSNITSSNDEIEARLIDDIRGVSEAGYQLFMEMKENDPIIYRELMDGLIDLQRSARVVDADEVANFVRTSMVSYFSEKASQLSDEGLVRHFELSMRQFVVMGRHGLDAQCMGLFMGREIGSLPVLEDLIDIDIQQIRTMSRDSLDSGEFIEQDKFISHRDYVIEYFRSEINQSEWDQFFDIFQNESAQFEGACNLIAKFNQSIIHVINEDESIEAAPALRAWLYPSE